VLRARARDVPGRTHAEPQPDVRGCG